MESEQHVLLKPITIKVILAIVVLWLIKGLQVIFSWDLGRYGVFPRSFDGLIGLLFAPLIHGSFEHLFSAICNLRLGHEIFYKIAYPFFCAKHG
jgi:membrane associated rhomboid family serine protease